MLHSWTVVYVTIFFAMLIVLIGVACNAFLIFVITKSRRLKGENHKLIANLAMSDLLQSLNMVFMLVTLFSGGNWILEDIACKVNAFLTTEFLLASMFTICAISVNRYVKIVKPRLYIRVFNEDTINKILVIIWAFPLLFAVPPLVGWSSYAFKPGKCICLVKSTYISSYGFTLSIFTLGVNVPVILFCYCSVFRAVCVHSVRMDNHRHRRSDSCMNVEEIRITRTLLVVIAAYILCFIPVTIISMIKTSTQPHRIPAWLELMSVMLVFANQALDPIIYGFFNTQYRRAMCKMTAKILLRRFPTHTSMRAGLTFNSPGTPRSFHGQHSVGGALMVLFMATENELLRQGVRTVTNRII